MTIPEIIEDLKVIAAIIEWDHSLEHQVTIEEAIKILREVENGIQNS